MNRMRNPLRGIAIAVALLAAPLAGAIESGEPAPAFELTQVNYPSKVRLVDFKGKVVLVDFWASWCAPCRHSLPLYNKLRASFDRDDFDIVAVNLDEDVADARAFLARHPIEYTTLQNPQGDVAKSFGLSGMPSSYLIDRNGVVSAKHIGFDDKDIAALRRQIIELIGKTPAGKSHAP